MKTRSTLAIALCALTLTATSPATAQSAPNVSHGITFLPPDFYHDHREALGLSDEQLKQMQQIAEDAHQATAERESTMRERTQALHEVMAKHPADADAAAERLRALLEIEGQVKAAQLRARITIRNVLSAGQFGKLTQLAKNVKMPANANGGTTTRIQQKFAQVKQEIQRRTDGGEPPREIMGQLEQIEAFARNGNLAEAEERLNHILGNLRGAGNGESRERSMRRPPAPRGDAELDERVRRLHGVQTDDLELREQIQGALKRLKEAGEAGNQDAIRDILNAIEGKLPKNLIEKQRR